MLELSKLCSGYQGDEILHEVSLAFSPGKVLILLGPNGCGKSTLLRTACGLIPKLGGEVRLDGKALGTLSRRQIAQKVAYLPQSRNAANLTAERMVLHGRFPYLNYPRRYRKKDFEIARQALEWVDAIELRDRPLTELSGGQRQKIYLAMALAQDTETILMDEPTTYLDVRHQLEVMALVHRLASQGKAVVMVLHDLCLAMQAGDEIALLSQGRLLQRGSPEELYTGGLLDKTMGISLRRVAIEDGWRYYYGLKGKFS